MSDNNQNNDRFRHAAEWLSRATQRGLSEARDAANEGMARLERYRVEGQLDDLWVRLGKDTRRLMDDGAISHAELQCTLDRIIELERRLAPTSPEPQ